jgi:excisionase family DNA binding protein
LELNAMFSDSATPQSGDPDVELVARLIEILLGYCQARSISLHKNLCPGADQGPASESLRTVREVAERLSLSDRQIRYAIQHGHLRAVRLKGKSQGPIRVPDSAIQDYLANCEIGRGTRAMSSPRPPKGRPFKHLKGVSGPAGGLLLGS